MELYNAIDMPLSSNPDLRLIQEKKLRNEELSTYEKLQFGGRDHTIDKIGDYVCRKDCCYRAISEGTLELYREKGFIIDERRIDYIEGQNNQGIDWYLGGAMPCKKYGYIIIECPAYKNYFVVARDNGLGMSDDLNVRFMKSSPQNNPIPFNMITNIFDYRKILIEQYESLNSKTNELDLNIHKK